MKQFENLYFTINSDSTYWYKVGIKLNTDDGRIIKIKPIHASKISKTKWQIRINAEIVLKYLPKISKNNTVFLLKSESKYLKNALRTYSNLISVTDHCSVKISGPAHSSGFIPDNEDELKFLEKTNGFEDTSSVQPTFSGKFFDVIHKDPLLDRIEGVSFLASSNLQDESLGKFRDCIRLFENAFSSTTNELAKHLFDFLSTNSQFDYSEDEVLDWMVDTRHGATHADQRKKFIFSSDLNADIQRIQQAAYDVLFNKKIWHDTSLERRNNLEFSKGITKTGWFLVRDKNDEKTLCIKDEDEDEEFFHPDTNIDNLLSKEFQIPQNWWIKYSNSDGKSFLTDSLDFEVR